VNKIIRSGGEVITEGDAYDFESEKTLLAKLLDYPEVVRLSARDLEPHKIATYLYELARDLNRYYETTRVIDADSSEKAARLGVLSKVSHVFNHGLSLLGIEVPTQM
jgi:arginyl-tRNA synthetase